MDKLDKAEKELLKTYDNDEWISVANLASEKLKYQEITRYTIQKNKRRKE